MARGHDKKWASFPPPNEEPLAHIALRAFAHPGSVRLDFTPPASPDWADFPLPRLEMLVFRSFVDLLVGEGKLPVLGDCWRLVMPPVFVGRGGLLPERLLFLPRLLSSTPLESGGGGGSCGRLGRWGAVRGRSNESPNSMSTAVGVSKTESPSSSSRELLTFRSGELIMCCPGVCWLLDVLFRLEEGADLVDLP
eukprot:1322883-Amorphochlora_amoeboformis.AAC.3